MEQLFLSIVIPAYNEEYRLPRTLEKITSYLEAQDYRFEVIIVDDGSEDGTVRVVEDFMATHPDLHLIRNAHRGKGYAVRTGMLGAQGKYVLFSDADLATPIEEVEKLLSFLEAGYDIAIGSREGVGARRYGEPGYRHLMGRVFNLLVRLIVLRGFRDTQCGFKCFRREVARDLFHRVKLYGAEAGQVRGGAVTGFDVEILLLARKAGYSVMEVPVEWYYGANARVNLLRAPLRMFKDILKVRLNDWRGVYVEKGRR
ncbi:MAG: dolichyl-phosphate beta-glucosyltransferase [Chloroflexota bacterium]|nr:dolichyl-phosphate beta-glucosyltransferase [Chloroflexota bacterium]